MTAVVVVGAQWGDEGKGKIIDHLAERADMVVRFQGGNNAGHTVVIGDQKFVLHHLPSGVLQPAVHSVIAAGVVIDPAVLCQEIDGLAARGIALSGRELTISGRAQVIMPYHRQLDTLREARLGEGKIGTTGRGIGPTYEDAVARRGVRVQDLGDAEALSHRLDRVLPERNAIIEWLGGTALAKDTVVDEYLAYGERLMSYVGDASALVSASRARNETILFEGAQGSLLDVTHGTYPFVTSSSTIAGAVCTSCGYGPRGIDHVLGITKAYATRVGAGPFWTELHDETGDFLQKQGAEFGATTGRRRRCGWLDVAALRYAMRINGVDGLAVTKLDVLSGLERIRVCVGYRIGGRTLSEPSNDGREQEGAVPIYQEFAGWTEDITAIQRIEELPAAARAYLTALESLTQSPIVLLSVGPDRAQTLICDQQYFQ